MQERSGVRMGQGVRDLDGTPLGQVTALYEQGFRVSRGFLLFRRDLVAGYDEVRGVRDGELVLARSPRDLLDLAAGGTPPSWRVPVPPDYPALATPPEAARLREDLARGGISAESPPPFPAHAQPRGPEEERPAAGPIEQRRGVPGGPFAESRPSSDHQ